MYIIIKKTKIACFAEHEVRSTVYYKMKMLNRNKQVTRQLLAKPCFEKFRLLAITTKFWNELRNFMKHIKRFAEQMVQEV